MSTKDKILELLSRESLTENEITFLNDVFDEHPELRIYESILNSLKQIPGITHLDSNLISEYVLYKNNQPLEDTSVIKIVPQIEKHISRCDRCRSEFELFNSEFTDLDVFVSSEIKSSDNVRRNSSKELLIQRIFDNKSFRYSFVSLMSLTLIYFSLFAFSQLTLPQYKSIESLNEIENFSANRGRLSLQFQQGVDAINKNEFGIAAGLLEDDVVNNPGDETIFYTHYTLGQVYLRKSERDILGLFTSFDLIDVDKAIYHFEESVNKNNSRVFENITYDSYYYLGRAYLLRDDIPGALRFLKLVKNNKGRFYKEAEMLLTSLQ